MIFTISKLFRDFFIAIFFTNFLIVSDRRRHCLSDLKVKLYSCPKFDGDAKQTLEIRVERIRNNRSKKRVLVLKDANRNRVLKIKIALMM